MKAAGRMLSVFFGLLILWSCQALVEKPEPTEFPAELPPAPIQAVLTAAPKEDPVQARTVITEGETVHRSGLPMKQTADAPVKEPVRDRNGIPLTGRSYVRTVYTACRLEETSG